MFQSYALFPISRSSRTSRTACAAGTFRTVRFATVVVTPFVAGRTITFPLWVYGASRFGVPPQVNVMGTILFVVGVAFAGVAVAVQRRGSFTRRA